MKAPHPVPPLLTAWLRERDQAALVDSGMPPLAIFMIAANMAGARGLPLPVLQEWAHTVRMQRLLVAQCIPRLLSQLHTSGLADEAVCAELGLDGSVSLDDNSAIVEREHQRVRQHYIDMTQHYADVLGTAPAAGNTERPE